MERQASMAAAMVRLIVAVAVAAHPTFAPPPPSPHALSCRVGVAGRRTGGAAAQAVG